MSAVAVLKEIIHQDQVREEAKIMVELPGVGAHRKIMNDI